ncbi:MAG: ATP-binding cassette domain-containing protein [Treponema sp.]|jgi:ABC-type glutathione transport system ATPase component|nr:ATP-binding cassette domain-containing protein [Treponema sp.]
MAGIIELDNVSFSAQNQDIVRGVSFTFEEGKATALVGSSGCGKSTVLKLAAGLLLPTGGRVSFRGKDVLSMSRQENLAFRKEAAMIFQDSALWANQNLYQILELPLRIHFPAMQSAERERRIRAVLAEVGYRRTLSLRPAQLSMGEQKLIAFARAMMCQPRILFLDEWTESVDDSTAHRLINIVQHHCDEGKTAIFVSHDFHIVRIIADYIVMILDGKIFRSFTKDQIESDEDLAHHIEREFHHEGKLK